MATSENTAQLDKRKIATAMQTVEDDVPEPTRKRSSSFTAVIADLDVGETASRARRIDPSHTLADFAGNAAEWREDLRNSCAKSMRHAKARTGGEYSVAVAECLTPSREMFLVALVTRTA